MYGFLCIVKQSYKHFPPSEIMHKIIPNSINADVGWMDGVSTKDISLWIIQLSTFNLMILEGHEASETSFICKCTYFKIWYWDEIWHIKYTMGTNGGQENKDFKKKKKKKGKKY